MAEQWKHFSIVKEKNICTVLLNSPPVNVLTRSLMEELSSVLDWLDEQSDIRAVVLGSANPKIFCAGADITAFTEWDSDTGRENCMLGSKTYRRLGLYPAPVICAVNGGAYGGGLEMALACDIRIFEEGTKVALPESSLGIIPGYGGTQRLPRTAGASFAKMMMFTGEPVTAEEALRVGIADKVVPVGEGLAAACKMAEKIASNAPIAVKHIKKNVAYTYLNDIEEGLNYENESIGVLCGTADKDEGAKAFVEKRKPDFRNC